MTKIKTSSHFIKFHLFSEISKTNQIIYNQFDWLRSLFGHHITLPLIDTSSSSIIVKFWSFTSFALIIRSYSRLSNFKSSNSSKLIKTSLYLFIYFTATLESCYSHVTASIQSHLATAVRCHQPTAPAAVRSRRSTS